MPAKMFLGIFPSPSGVSYTVVGLFHLVNINENVIKVVLAQRESPFILCHHAERSQEENVLCEKGSDFREREERQR